MRSLSQFVTLLWTFKLPWHWGNHGTLFYDGVAQFAFGFYSVMFTSTVLGLITMVLYKPRSWCVYCPMGTLTQLICKQRTATNLKWEFRIVAGILVKYTTNLKSDFRLVGGLVWHIFISLIIEENGILYPVEIKMSANPKASMGATNQVLDKIKDKQRGMGIILCLIDKKTYLRENLIALPIRYI